MAGTYRDLFQRLPVGMYVSTPDGRILDANPALLTLLAAPDAAALLSRRSSDFYVNEADRKAWVERMEKEGVVRESVARIRRLDGEVISVRESARAVLDEDGTVVRYEGTMEDVTDQVRIAGTLRRREAALQAVAFAAERLLLAKHWEEAASEILARLGAATEVSRVYLFRNHFGRGGELLTSQTHEWAAEGVEPQIDNPEMQGFCWRDERVGRWGQVLRKNRVFSALRRELPAVEQEILLEQDILSLLLVPIFTEEEWWGFIGFDECREERVWEAAEVDALRLAGGAFAAAIRRERANADRLRLERAVEETAESIVITDAAGDIQYVNPEFTRVTGYEAWEAKGQNPRFLKSGKHDEAFYREMWGTLTRGRVWRGRLVNRKRDGSLFEEEAAISPIRDAAGTIRSYVAVKRDVTREVALRRELLQAQKMQSLGRLASGIAHDFNNLLGQVLGAAERIRARVAGDGLGEYLDLIFKAVDRGRNITRRMLNFSRVGEEGVEAVPVSALLSDLEQVAKHTFPKRIELALRRPEEEIHLLCDRTQIQQVLMNLCLNAVDAMPEGGRLSLGARRSTEEERERHAGRRGESYAVLEVADTGVGIDPGVVEEIFDPFFTTKPPGKGTGLGLFLVYGIIRAHGGWVEVDTEPGRGTSFLLGLPTTDTPAGEKEEASSADTPEGHGEHVLVVDDEAGLVQLLTEVLTEANYRVSSATDGRAALEFFEAHGTDVELVITDIGMPRMGGRDLVERLRRLDPGLRIIVTSGFVDPTEFADLARFGVRHVITKPFDVDEVLRAVADTFTIRVRPEL